MQPNFNHLSALSVDESNNLNRYLLPTEVVDSDHSDIIEQAQHLTKMLETEFDRVRVCFEFVRDHIRHTGDQGFGRTTLKASDVLSEQTGWCYAKSHLLAALLRSINIPTALCYQRLSCSEYKPGVFCLHGLNAVYLTQSPHHGWYRLDPRGNKEGVNAQFTPPTEQLAFALTVDEFDLPKRYADVAQNVRHALTNYVTYDEMVNHFPDVEPD